MNNDSLPFVNGNESIVIITFFSIYIILSIVELFFGFLEKEKQRKIIKPFLMFIMTIMMIFVLPYHTFLYLGCLFGLLGDIFFIFKKKKVCVYFGLFTFLLNHVFYITEIIVYIFTLQELMIHILITYVIVYSIFLCVSFILIKKILKTDNKLSIAGSFYMTTLFLDFGMCVYLFTLNQSYMLLSIIGMISFIISDSILSYTMFVKDIRRRDFYIMSTYLLAQGLFLLGMIFTYLY